MTERQQKHRWRPIDFVMALISAIVVALFVLAGAFIYFEKSGQQTALNEAKARLDDLKKRHVPVDAESLNTHYLSKTSPADTAAWVKVFNRLAPKKSQKYVPGASPYGQPHQTVGDALLKNPLELQQDLVAENAELLQTVHVLAQHQRQVQFDIKYNLATTRDDLTYVRQLMDLLTSQLQVAIADNNLEQIQQSLDTQFGILHVLHGEDMLVDFLIFTAVRETVYRNIKELLEKNLLNRQSLEQVSNKISALPIDDWRSLVNCERAIMLPYFQGQTPLVFPRDVPEDAFLNPTAKDYLNYLTYMDRFENVNWSSWATAKAELESIESDFQKQTDTMSAFEKRNWKITLLNLGSWSYVGEKFAQDRSERNQAYLACALRLYQLKHGDFPDRLEQLTDVAIDPTQYLSIANVPFGYEVKDNIAYLWRPVRNDDNKLPLQISSAIPIAAPDATVAQREHVNQALWRLPQ